MNEIKFSYKHNHKLIPLAKTLRKNMTKEEKRLWYDFLKDYPVRFIRQKTVGNYIVDFYCAKAKIAIEVDGSQHYTLDGLVLEDEVRTKEIEGMGLKVLRVLNVDINNNFGKVCADLDFEIQQRLPLRKGAGKTEF